MTELTGQVNPDSWPSGTRLICRRERPHPGAQLSFTDVDGHRLQRFEKPNLLSPGSPPM